MVLLILAILLLEVLGTESHLQIFFQNSWCLVAVSVMYVKVTALPENSRMLNSSLFLLLRFKKKGAKHLSSWSFQFLTHLVCFQIILVLSPTCVHNLNYLCFHLVQTIGLSYCADSSPSALQIVFLTATRTILLMKVSLCHFSAQNHPVPPSSSLLQPVRSHSVSFCFLHPLEQRITLVPLYTCPIAKFCACLSLKCRPAKLASFLFPSRITLVRT